jgi:NADP-dependent 3-hydroxy acid dehydrogenase YdfG
MVKVNPQSPVILITGGSSGIGEATARLFAGEGYRVVLAARRYERLQALAQEIQDAGGQALAVETDVSQLASIRNLVDATLAHYGQIDILFNNAGFGRLNWLEKLDPVDDIETVIKTNLTGLIQTTWTVLPHMIQRRSGHIINMVSIAGLVATPTYTIYAASKFGGRGFTDSLRREVGVWGIRVSGIYPGAVYTEFPEHAGINRKTGITTPPFLVLNSETVARAVFSLVRRPRRMLVIPWPMKIGWWFASLFPWISDRIFEWSFVRPERKGP